MKITAVCRLVEEHVDESGNVVPRGLEMAVGPESLGFEEPDLLAEAIGFAVGDNHMVAVKIHHYSFDEQPYEQASVYVFPKDKLPTDEEVAWIEERLRELGAEYVRRKQKSAI